MTRRVFLPRTKMLKKEEARDFVWFIVDARGRTLGRLASVVCDILRGKVSTRFTPNVLCGFGVIITNAADVFVSGSKALNKVYHTYSGYIGGQKELRYEHLIQKSPGYILQRAIKGMLPKNRLSARILAKRLKIFADDDHRLMAYSPIPV